MEFTVSKTELVRELSLSQGVVEKKTTIPILSNVLLETDGDRDHPDRHGSGAGDPCSCPARVKKEGAGTVPARKLLDYVRLLPEADVNMKFAGQPLGEPDCAAVRGPASRGCRARAFRNCRRCRRCSRRSRSRRCSPMIARTIFAISMRRVALHAERRAAAAAAATA